MEGGDLYEQKCLELKQLQQTFDEYVASSTDIEKLLEDENTKLSIKYDKLKRDFQQLQDENEGTKDRSQQVSNDILRLQLSLEKKTQLNTTLKDSVRNLQQLNDELNTSVRIIDATNKELEYKLELAIEEKVFLQTDMEEKIKQQQNQKENNEADISELKAQLFELQQAQQGKTIPDCRCHMKDDMINTSTISASDDPLIVLKEEVCKLQLIVSSQKTKINMLEEGHATSKKGCFSIFFS